MDVHLLVVFVPNQLIAATATNLQHQAVVWCANKEGVELQYFAINDIDLWYDVLRYQRNSFIMLLKR